VQDACSIGDISQEAIVTNGNVPEVQPFVIGLYDNVNSSPSSVSRQKLLRKMLSYNWKKFSYVIKQRNKKKLLLVRMSCDTKTITNDQQQKIFQARLKKN
jgi:hypothetical protein